MYAYIIILYMTMYNINIYMRIFIAVNQVGHAYKRVMTAIVINKPAI